MNTYDSLTGAQELDLWPELEMELESDGRLESEPGDKLSFGRPGCVAIKYPPKSTHSQTRGGKPRHNH